MQNVIEKEAAEIELQNIIDFFEVDPEGKEWESSRPKLLGAIMKGRVVLDEEAEAVMVTLVKPIELENGKAVPELKFSEPTAGDLKVFDKYKKEEGMSKTIHLASKMTGQPVGVIERVGTRDLSVIAAVTSLFF